MRSGWVGGEAGSQMKRGVQEKGGQDMHMKEVRSKCYTHVMHMCFKTCLIQNYP